MGIGENVIVLSIEDRLIHEKSFFDAYWSKLDAHTERKYLSIRLGWELWRVVFNMMGPIKDRLILDVGCGIGLDSICLRLKGARVVGLDISPRAEKKAKAITKKLHVKCEFVVGSIEKAPFVDGGFDMAFGRGVLHHVDIPSCSIEAKRLVRDRCLFIEPLALNPIVNIARHTFKRSRRTLYEKPLRLQSTSDILKKYFEYVLHKEFYLISLIAYALVYYLFKSDMRRHSFYFHTWKVLNDIDEKLQRRIPFLKNLCWITIVTLIKNSPSSIS